MAAKYHISPTTGRPNLCRAEIQACPVGGAHYVSKEAAQAAYEKEMASVTLAAPVSKKTPKNYASPFKPDQLVRGATVWAYDAIVEEAGGRGALHRAHPGLRFDKATGGELVVTGPAGAVEAYVQEPGGRVRDIAASLSNLKPYTPRGAKAEAVPAAPAADAAVFAPTPSGPRFTAKGEALPDDNLFEDWEASGGWEGEPDVAALAQVEEQVKDLDDDFSDIKCDDCKNPLNACTCGECEQCGALEGEDHYEDCPFYVSRPKAYSWD